LNTDHKPKENIYWNDPEESVEFLRGYVDYHSRHKEGEIMGLHLQKDEDD